MANPDTPQSRGSKLPRSMRQRLEDARNQPEIAPLLEPFWYDGELAILFADAGVGKSTLAVQIAEYVSKGMGLYGLKGPPKPMRVLMLEFELSDRQIALRYKDEATGEYHDFDENFYCDTIDFASLAANHGTERLDEAVLNEIRNLIIVTQANVVFIDNISYLKMQTASDTQTALEVMKALVALKRELNVSILVLAHTPKIYESRPISINHLAGSKNLANFADAVFALGRSSSDANVVYMKQIKASRSGEFIYDADNVLILRRSRVTPAFLGFTAEGTDSEHKHMRQRDPAELIRVRDKAQELHATGLTFREIAEKLLGDRGKASTIHNWIKGAKTGSPAADS